MVLSLQCWSRKEESNAKACSHGEDRYQPFMDMIPLEIRPHQEDIHYIDPMKSLSIMNNSIDVSISNIPLSRMKMASIP